MHALKPRLLTLEFWVWMPYSNHAPPHRWVNGAQQQAADIEAIPQGLHAIAQEVLRLRLDAVAVADLQQGQEFARTSQQSSCQQSCASLSCALLSTSCCLPEPLLLPLDALLAAPLAALLVAVRADQDPSPGCSPRTPGTWPMPRSAACAPCRCQWPLPVGSPGWRWWSADRNQTRGPREVG